jgi:hypothetical protein
MLRHVYAAATLIATSFAGSAVAASSSEYSCVVLDMLNFSDDSEFIAKNMEKRFLIALDDERMYVTVLSKEFRNYQNIYKIVNRLPSAVYGIELSPASMGTVALSENLFEGRYNATLLTQSTLGVTVWKLGCDAV